MAVSPSRNSPVASSARSATSSMVDGYTRPRAPRSLAISSIATTKLPGHLRQRREHQVADGMAAEVCLRVEPVLEQAVEFAVARERRQTVPDIPRRQHPEVPPQPAGAAAVIGHRHNCTQQVGRERLFRDPTA